MGPGGPPSQHQDRLMRVADQITGMIPNESMSDASPANEGRVVMRRRERATAAPSR